MDLVKDSLVKASFLTCLFLVLGILVGLQMSDLRQDHTADNLDRTSLETETFSVLQDYMDESGDNFCEISSVRLPEVGQRNAELGSQLERFDSQEFSNENEYNYIRDRYYNNQLKLYMMVNEHNERCDGDQDTILYFFDDSTQSQRQGAVLDEIARNQGSFIFAFNMDILEDPERPDSPILEVLVEDYNITESPSIVVNGEKSEGFVSQGEIREKVTQN